MQQKENLQARIRGMLLMAVSNKLGHIVLSTGNKSEMAMGYSTLYGIQLEALQYSAISQRGGCTILLDTSIKDSEIIPIDTIEKPPSAELRPDQKDSDTLPPYDLIDTVVEEYVEEWRVRLKRLQPNTVMMQLSYGGLSLWFIATNTKDDKVHRAFVSHKKPLALDVVSP